MDELLKSCPFCGADAVIAVERVECQDDSCPARPAVWWHNFSEINSEEKARAAWNRRVPCACEEREKHVLEAMND